MFAKWWKFITKKKRKVTSLIYVFNFSKSWIGFIMISKIKILKIKINLMWELFVFNVGIIKITFELLLIKSNL
jgi:hypothetical protein